MSVSYAGNSFSKNAHKSTHPSIFSPSHGILVGYKRPVSIPQITTRLLSIALRSLIVSQMPGWNEFAKDSAWEPMLCSSDVQRKKHASRWLFLVLITLSTFLICWYKVCTSCWFCSSTYQCWRRVSIRPLTAAFFAQRISAWLSFLALLRAAVSRWRASNRTDCSAATCQAAFYYALPGWLTLSSPTPNKENWV